MLNVCPNCHYFGKNKNNYSPDDYYDGLLYSVFGSIFLISGLIFSDGIGSNITLVVIAIFLLVAGIRKLIRYTKGCICPKCNHKPMLSMDNPEAIKLIKQYDLEPCERTTNKTQNVPKTTSSFKAPES